MKYFNHSSCQNNEKKSLSLKLDHEKFLLPRIMFGYQLNLLTKQKGEKSIGSVVVIKSNEKALRESYKV